jgi:cellulose synthase/poly-beta-1,6-N-acetylglucosamine synthase-like glycosyltransferase
MEFITYGVLFAALYFEVFLLLSFLEKRENDRKGTVAGSYAPSVCVVVPCFNEEASIKRTLASLISLRYPAEKLEILVVDDGSTDGTLEMARAFENAEAPRVRVFTKENGGKHTAMNMALAQTNAEFIGCLDADSFVAPDALSRMVRLFRNAKVAAVTPGLHVWKPRTFLQHMQNVEYRLAVFNRFVFAVLGSLYITPGPFSIFRTSVVRELGGWRHAHATEDMEMAMRLQEAGHLIGNAPRAAVYTITPESIRPLFRQRIRWTYGFLRNAFDYRHMLASRAHGNLGLIILPAAFVSIASALYFFVHIMWEAGNSAFQTYELFQLTGAFPHPSFEVFYINTSAMWILTMVAMILIFALVCMGSRLGTGRPVPPMATPFFLFLYGFIMPVWLAIAVVRAMLRTGVNWR